MIQGFKKFILKGNVVDLAVGVVVGVSFGAVVTALVKDVITPIIGIFGGTPDFSALSFTINGSKFLIGDFINSLLSFLTISTVIYVFVVIPMNKLTEITKKCSECLSDIPVNARRCAYCASVIVPNNSQQTTILKYQ